MPLSRSLAAFHTAWPGDFARLLKQGIRRAGARGFAEGWARYDADGPAVPLPALRDAMAAAAPGVRERVRQAAQALTEGRFSALGRDWPRRWPGTPLPAALWQLDPVTGRLWPGADTFAFDIQVTAQARLGDVRYALEINRLHMLQPLAARVLIDDGAAAERALIEEIIASWHDGNPPFRGIAWRCGLECALRAISLVVVASLAGAHLSAETHARLRRMLAAHAFWLDRFGGDASAHPAQGLAEAAAALMICAALPDAPQTPGRAARARRAIADEASRLILDDGAPARLGPAAGAFSAELLLLAAVVANAMGEPLDASVTLRLVRFARLVDWLADSRGRIPAIGEDAEHRVLSLGAPEPCYATSVARTIAAAAEEASSPATPAPPPHLRDALLAGVAQTAPASPPQGVATFPLGGLSVVRAQRAGRTLTLVLCGHAPPAAPVAADRPHADALALLLAVDGRPLLVDAGSYLTGGADWDAWFRSAAAHNTLSMATDGAAVGARVPASRHRADARLDSVTDGDQWRLAASHGGYTAAFGVRHSRTLAASPEGFELRDRLIGSDTPQPVEIVFQLAPDCAAVREDRVVTVTPAGGQPVRLVFETPGDLALTRGGGLGTGWVSPAFGSKVPAWRIAWRGRIASAGALVRIVL